MMNLMIQGMLQPTGTATTLTIPITSQHLSSIAMQVRSVLSAFVILYYNSKILMLKKVIKFSAGPFTQLVWGATEKFGCGKARNSNGKVSTT